MKKEELHLLIIWEKARSQQERILNDIEKNIKILDCFEIEWSRKYVANNFTRFYGVNLPNKSFKEKECGGGKFLLVTMLDTDPCYEMRETSHREELVNVKMFDSKTKYRRWTGGGHKIHATNNPQETNHDITLLLGVNYDDYMKSINSSWNHEIKKIKRDLSGTISWKNLKELFYILNNTINYVILRGGENLSASNISEEHPDIDLLIENYKNAVFILNGTQITFYPIRPKVQILIEGKNYIFDLWDTELSYHSNSWHKNMLENRILGTYFYHLDIENDFYSLIYHCLIHKNHISIDYLPYLKKMFYALKLNNLYSLDEYVYPMDLYYQLLIEYMDKKQYMFLEAQEDWHCFFNQRVVSLRHVQKIIETNTNIKEVTPYLVNHYGGSGYVYFTGVIDQTKVFIKYGGVGNTCENEYHYSKLMSSCNSVNFLSPIFYFNDKQHSFIAFEFVDAIPLTDYLQTIGLEVGGGSIGIQIANIYQTLYQNGIMHRDIRPENFIISSGKVKLLDFQFAVNFWEFRELPVLKENTALALSVGSGDYKYSKSAWYDLFSMQKICKFWGFDLSLFLDTSKYEKKIVSIPYSRLLLYKLKSKFCNILFHLYVLSLIKMSVYANESTFLSHILKKMKRISL